QLPLRGGKLPHPAEEETNQIQDDQLGGERLRRGYADLGTSVHINSAIAFAGNCAGHVVTNAKGAVTFAFAFPQPAQGIGSFAALADREDKGVFGRRRVAMAIFARKIDVDGNVRQLLDDVFADARGVQRGSAASKNRSEEHTSE